MSENPNNPYSPNNSENTASDQNFDAQNTTGGSYSAQNSSASSEAHQATSGSSYPEANTTDAQHSYGNQGSYSNQNSSSGQNSYGEQASNTSYGAYNNQPNGQSGAGQYGATASAGQYGSQNAYGNQYGNDPYNSYNGTQTPVKKQKNVLGIVSIALSALGLILGCIPGIMFLGWILLFAGFVTGIVGLFQKFKEKITPIIGIVLSVLGSIISGIVMIFVVAGAVADATPSYSEIESSVSAAAPSSVASSAVASSDATPTVPEGVLAFGKTAEYSDGLKITVSEPANFTPSDTSASLGDESLKDYRKFTVTIENGTDEAFDPSLIYLSGNSGGKEASQVFDSEQNIMSAPNGKILPGDKVSYDVAFGVADPGNITLEAEPDFDREGVIFSSKK